MCSSFYKYILICEILMIQLLQLKLTTERLDNLRKFLEACDMNPVLDFKQYRAGMSLWMKSLGVDIDISFR